MKKIMMMVVAAMMVTVNANAQVEDLRHEIGVTYGTGLSVVVLRLMTRRTSEPSLSNISII